MPDLWSAEGASDVLNECADWFTKNQEEPKYTPALIESQGITKLVHLLTSHTGL
jgi:hypothetical protein